MSKILKIIGNIILLFIAFFSMNLIVTADDDNVGFNIQMIPSSKQINRDVSYFDLRLLPDEKETIKIRVNNTSDKESGFIVNVNQAYTNEQGFIDYTDTSGAKDNQVPIKVNDIVTYEKKIKIPAQSSIDFPIDIKMPNELYDGQISAGIQVLKDQKKVDGQINVDYGYILGLKITETDNPVKRKMELIKVEPEAYFGKPTIVVKLKNPTMDAYGHLKYVAKVIDKKTNKSVYDITYDKDMEMAPNSIFGLPLNKENQRLSPGEYQLNLVVSDAKKNKWEFKEEFSISKKQAKEINSLTIDQAQKKFDKYIWIISCLVIILLIIIVYFYKKSRKNKK